MDTISCASWTLSVTIVFIKQCIHKMDTISSALWTLSFYWLWYLFVLYFVISCFTVYGKKGDVVYLNIICCIP